MRYSLPLVLFMLLCNFSFAGDNPSAGESTPSLEEVRVAAQAGDAEAQWQLGDIYIYGRGVEKDPGKAVEWYRKSAEQNNDQACFMLGLCYWTGTGVKGDRAEAAKYFLEASVNGHVESAAWAGEAILRGHLDGASPRKGIELLRLAAAEGSVRGQSWLAGHLWHGELWNKEVLADKKEAAFWAKKAADAGDADAQIIYALCAKDGTGVPKNRDDAKKYLLMAANQEGPWACRLVALSCRYGDLFTKDLVKSFEWMDVAASHGDVTAQRLLGEYYATGIGVKKNVTEAIRWYQKAADTGDAPSQARFGQALFFGNGIPKRTDQAVKWFLRAAHQGDVYSQRMLARIYSDGTGVPRNLEQAYFWQCLCMAHYGDDEERRFLQWIEARLTPVMISSVQRAAAKFVPIEESGRPVVENATNTRPGPKNVSAGSGFFVTTTGYFVTNQHVVDGAKKIEIKVGDQTYVADVVRADETRDLAVLKVEGEFDALYVRGSRGLKVAEQVSTVGFPNSGVQGVAPKYTLGAIAALSGMKDDPGSLQISVPIQKGNSGGPLVDSHGNVVGVIVAMVNKMTVLKESDYIPENVNYAIKGSVLLDVLESVPGLANELVQEEASCETGVEVFDLVKEACGMVICKQ